MNQINHTNLEYVASEARRLMGRLAICHEITLVASRSPHGYCLRWGIETPDPNQIEPSDLLPWRPIASLDFTINYGAHRKTEAMVWLMDKAGELRSGRPIKRSPSGMIHLIGHDDFVPAYWQPYVLPAVPASILNGAEA